MAVPNIAIISADSQPQSCAGCQALLTTTTKSTDQVHTKEDEMLQISMHKINVSMEKSGNFGQNFTTVKFFRLKNLIQSYVKRGHVIYTNLVIRKAKLYPTIIAGFLSFLSDFIYIFTFHT